MADKKNNQESNGRKKGGGKSSDAPDVQFDDQFAAWQPNGFHLADIPINASVNGETYDRVLNDLQNELRELQLAFLHNRLKGVIVFEGWDAAGKGGTIRRLTSVMDPRAVRVWPISAPDHREQQEHYLQRFWRRLPPNGELGIFDRSWYGRVLVERVEEFATREEWGRAYGEINAFEASLAADGFRLVKIFLHVSHEVQAQRFRDRLNDPLKQWKLTEEDLRNRDKRSHYEEAVEEMVRRTSAPDAPWHVLPANDKKFARLAGLSTIIKSLGAGVDLEPPALSPEFLAKAKKELGAENGKK